MKKILTILTVALLACSTVFAAAVNLSGEFEGGYKFLFSDGEYSATTQDGKTEGKVTLKFTDDAGIWTVNVKGLATLDSGNALKANLSLNLAALMAANGVDLGDVSLALSLGANDKMTALSAYNDVTGDELYKFKNNGKYSTELAVGYGDLIQTKIAVDPVTTVTTEKGKEAGEFSLVASALTKPVDGVAVSVAYAHNGYFKLSDETEKTPENAASVAADINVGALAGLDFDLGVTVYDNFGWQKDASDNAFAAAVYGGVDVVDAFFEFRMDNVTVAKETATTLGMKTQVNLNVIENVGLDVYFAIKDFDNVEGSYTVGGDVSYTISGVKFAGKLNYEAGAGFSVTPKIVVTF